MIRIALIIKGKPRYYFPQFLGLIKESDEFNSIFVSYDKGERIFDIISVKDDVDIRDLSASLNYYNMKNCDGLFIDKRTIPDYVQKWELDKLASIFSIYLSIALEDLVVRR